MTEKELLQTQMRSFQFYADLIERATRSTGDELPRWNSEKAQKFRELAEQYKQRLQEIELKEQQAS